MSKYLKQDTKLGFIEDNAEIEYTRFCDLRHTILGCMLGDYDANGIYVLSPEIKKELIAMPASTKMVELVRYMSGKTRIGEYFLRTNQISLEELETVLEQQEKIKKATNEQVGSATVLVNMGFVPEGEIKAVLRYKEESRKRFTMDALISDGNIGTLEDASSLKSTNERLLKENKILKLQLRKLLNLSE